MRTHDASPSPQLRSDPHDPQRESTCGPASRTPAPGIRHCPTGLDPGRLRAPGAVARACRDALFLASAFATLSLACVSSDPCSAPADPSFVAWGEPLFSGRVVFDESHRSFHCIAKSYRGTAETLRAVGFDVEAGSLTTPADVRVVLPPRVPVTASEAEELARWVASGGSLLILADHEPAATHLASLTAALGFGLGSEVVTPPGCAGDISGACGRYTFADSGVVTYAGVAVYGGDPILIFGDDAEVGGRSAAGLAQAARAELGAGRIVVLGEARVLSASSRGGIQVEANRELLVSLFEWLVH